MSMGGQDLRMPILGGIKMPTDDSKKGATKLLNASQSSAEVGPSPAPNALAAPKAPTMTTAPGAITTKVGEDMSNDPLMQYLQKGAMELEDNRKKMILGDEVPTLTREDPMPDRSAEKYLAKMHPPKPGTVDKVMASKDLG